MQTFYKICLILMIVGGINWGLVGLFQFDFVGWLLGGRLSLHRIKQRQRLEVFRCPVFQ